MKKWYKSKTMWFNILGSVITVSGVALQYMDQLGLTDQQAAISVVVLNVVITFGNKFLRAVTHTGLGK